MARVTCRWGANDCYRFTVLYCQNIKQKRTHEILLKFLYVVVAPNLPLAFIFAIENAGERTNTQLQGRAFSLQGVLARKQCCAKCKDGWGKRKFNDNLTCSGIPLARHAD